MIDESLTPDGRPDQAALSQAAVGSIGQAYASALMRAIDEGGLGLERELQDWLGADRLAEILSGAPPSYEESWAIDRMVGAPVRPGAAFEEPIDAAADAKTGVARPISAMVACVAVAIAGGASVIAGVSLQSAADMHAEAVAAEAFSARLVTTLAQELPHDAESGVFEAIGTEALARYEAGAGMNDPQLLSDWSRLFSIVGRQRWDAGDTSGARQALEAALDAAERRVDLMGGDLNAVFDHSQAAYYLAELNYRNGDFDAAEPGFDLYASLTAQLYEADPDRPLYQAEYAYGYLNTAVIDLERGRAEEALEGFSVASRVLADVAERSDAVSDLDVGNAIGWRAGALDLSGRLLEAADERARVLSIYEPLRLESGLGEIRWLHAAAQRAYSLLALGHIDEANALIEESLPVAEHRATANPDSLSTRRRYVALLLYRAEISLLQDNPLGAKLVLDNARFTETEGLDGGTRILPTREAAQFALLSADVALAMNAFETARDQASTALRLLDEIRHTDRYAPTQIARAYEALGEAELGLGNRDLAERAWRQGLAALDDGVGHYLEDVYRARLAYRTGDFDTARASYARHQNLGYAHPRDSAFWREASKAGIVQREVEGDMNDG